MNKGSRLKQQVIQEVESRSSELVDISHAIHRNPELAFQEVKACEWLTEYLGRNGFEIEQGFCQLPTAFKATFGTGHPAIAFLAEYDALPDIGHACGHNIIAAASVGAGVATKKAAATLGGCIMVIGTPGEELSGGKVIMVDRGGFDQVDAALMVHPGARNVATYRSLACASLEVEFFGKASHASAHPDEGVNALEAMLLAFNNINSLRQHVKDWSRIHGIITSGGSAPNIVPAYSKASFLVRSDRMDYLDVLKERVLDCFVGASVATGAKLKHSWGEVTYASLRNNIVLAKLFLHHMESLGREVLLSVPEQSPASTDMGNVSQVTIGIHPTVAITSPGTSEHSPEFAAAAVSEVGDKALLDAAKALALTAVDLLANSTIMVEAKQEFLNTT